MAPKTDEPTPIADQHEAQSKVSIVIGDNQSYGGHDGAAAGDDTTEDQNANLKPSAAGAAGTTSGGKKNGSRVLSVNSRSSSSAGEHRFAREISETFTWRLREMKWCFLALISNALLLAAIRAMQEGVIISVNKALAETIDVIVLEILLLITNIFTIMAMDSGCAAFFGFQMATRGRSMATIGFTQSHAIFKMSFANDLSLNSSVRKILNRLAFCWAIVEGLKLITPLGASSLRASDVRSDAFTVDCIEFTQATKPVDRHWPNLEAEIGFAELIFGMSVGRLRSEEDVPETMAIIGPQVRKDKGLFLPPHPLPLPV